MTPAFARLRREPAAGTDACESLVARYLGDRVAARQLRYTGVPSDSTLTDVTIDLLDTPQQSGLHPHRSTLWHVLWVRDETIASVQIEERYQVREWPIAPGDTVPIPANSTLTATGDQLGLAIGVPMANVNLSAPTHGSDRCFGYNRQTVAFQLGAIRLCRWKLTQPLQLADHYSQPLLMMALARSATIRTDRSIEQLQQGDIALIDPASNPSVLPDGLAYLLAIDSDVPG